MSKIYYHREGKMIISFTTTTNRINLLEPLLKSIRAQMEKEDKLVCYVSKEGPVLNGKQVGYDRGIKEIPSFFEKYDVKTKFVENLCAHTKIQQALVDYPDEIITCLCDDKIWPDYILEDLRAAWEEHPECAKTYNVGVPPQFSSNFVKEDLRFNYQAFRHLGAGIYKHALVKTVGLLSVKLQQFDSIIQDRQYIDATFMSDDLLYSVALMKKGTPIQVVSPRDGKTCCHHFKDLKVPKGDLWADNKNGGNDGILNHPLIREILIECLLE